MVFFIRAKRVSYLVQLNLILFYTNELYNAESISKIQYLLSPEIQRL
jgi:hypothetical protein